MYKRETRFKGQKRVSVGRITRNSDTTLDIKQKDRMSLRDDSDREWSYDDTSNTMKSFNGSVDPTVPDIQMNDDLRDQEECLVGKPSSLILILSYNSDRRYYFFLFSLKDIAYESRRDVENRYEEKNRDDREKRRCERRKGRN